jgi:hypothetical protein
MGHNELLSKRFFAMLTPLPAVPTGQIKSFGPFGPKYRVGSVVHPSQDKDWLVEITVLETGETTDYLLTHMYDDPEAP